MFKGATIKLFAITVMVSVSSISTAFASEIVSDNVTQMIQSANSDDKVTRSEARKIIKAYLKSKEGHQQLRLGKITKLRDKWQIDITSLTKIKVLATYVNDKTGKITFKR